MKRIFIAWGREAELSKYLAGALEAKFKQVYFKKFIGIPMPAFIRYIVQGVWTIIILLKNLPRVVIVQNPPIFLATLVLFYAKVFRAKFMIDTHTAAFWDRKWQFFYPLFKFTARRADLNTCHNYKNLEILKEWQVKPAMVVQFFNPKYNLEKLSKPLEDKELSEKLSQTDFPVMMVNRFASDDDWQTVIEVAKSIPQAFFFITGRPSAGSKKILAKSEIKNIYFTNYLPHNEFMKLMMRSEVVLAFTTRRDTVLWSIREALAVKTPFVTTDSEVMKHYFGDIGLFVPPKSPQELKEKILEARTEKKELQEKQRDFLIKDKNRWEEEIKEVKKYLGI